MDKILIVITVVICAYCAHAWEFSHYGSTYTFSEEKKNWNDAKYYCENHANGHLVKIDSGNKNTFLVEKYKEQLNDQRQFWIGLEREFECVVQYERDGCWKWSHDSELEYNFYWAPGYPKVGQGYGCVIAFDDTGEHGYWRNIRKTQLEYFICERSSHPCYNHQCQNGGTCKETGQGGEYRCNCDGTGYEGDYCDIVPVSNPCDGNPCRNGGVCQQNEQGGYQCNCGRTGYYGNRCDHDYDECSSNSNGYYCDNGHCENTPGSYECYCYTGYKGNLCQGDINECNSHPCPVHSTCVNTPGSYECPCNSGYEENRGQCVNIDECQRDSGPCNQNGACHDYAGGYRCECYDGYYGPNCQYETDECYRNPCATGSSCVDGVNSYTCTCQSGFTGKTCRIDIDECAQDAHLCENGDCKNTWGHYRCNCYPGFTGYYCDENVNECHSDPCGNDAKCVDGINEYICTCLDGFTGKNCNIDVNECDNKTICNSNGNCTNKHGSYECHCNEAFHGTNCELDVNECDMQRYFNVCGPHGNCTNNRGGFKCACDEKYSGDRCRQLEKLADEDVVEKRLRITLKIGLVLATVMGPIAIGLFIEDRCYRLKQRNKKP